MAATVARFSLKSAANAAFIAWALTQSMAFHFEQARKTEAAAGAQKADGTEDDAMDDGKRRHQRGGQGQHQHDEQQGSPPTAKRTTVSTATTTKRSW
jgi:hypothetical protein